MKRLVIADSHVGTLEGDAEAMVGFLGRCSTEEFDEIIYLGDAFQYLIGMNKFWTKSIHQVLDSWDRLRADGVKISLIEGNRDFFLDEPDLRSRIDDCRLDLQFMAGSSTYRLVHGDRVNQRDFQYLFWSRLSKSAIARIWARWLPQKLATRIVRTMEARLATTNQKYRYAKPFAALQKDALKTFERGVDVLLWGHFHSPWLFKNGGGTALVVPAWLDHRTALVIDVNGRWSVIDSDFKPAAIEIGGDVG